MRSTWTRRHLLRRGLQLGAVVVSGSGLAACTSTVAGTARAGESVPPGPEPGRVPPSSVPPAGPVRVAVAEFFPYVFEEGGTVTGQVPETARAVFELIGVTEVEFELVQFDVLLPAVQAGDVDLVGDLAITPERCARVLFSAPNYVSHMALVTNDPALENFVDVKAEKASLAVVDGTNEMEAAREAGIGSGQMAVFPTLDEMIAAISAGEADCAAYDDITLRARGDEEGFVVGPSFTPAGHSPLAFGFGFNQDDQGRAEEFSQGLAELRDSGEWLRIAQGFGFTEVNVPEPGMTVDSLCGR